MTSLLRMKPTEIIVHHSLTEDGETVSWSAIRRYHTIEKGWLDVGYHIGIELVGKDYEVFMGRPWDEAGAHCVGHNMKSLGLCFVGNFDLKPPPHEQLILGAKVISLWMRLFGISVDHVYPHSRFADKSCPGRRFSMEKLKGMLSA